MTTGVELIEGQPHLTPITIKKLLKCDHGNHFQ
jgi:hypothetical protein